MRIAILGGTFDPPHVGHGCMALYARMAGWDEVRVIPVGRHPFGKEATPFEHRMEMARLAFRDMAWVVVDGREGRRSGPSRTIDTIRELRAEFPGATLGLVIGEDNLAAAHKWHAWHEIEELCEIVVVGRGLSSSQPFSLPDVSSSELRQRIAAGQNVTGLVDVAVLEYARRHSLYQRTAPAVRWGLVGHGRVGGALAGALSLKGIPPAWVVTAHSRQGARFHTSFDGISDRPDVVVLAVPDTEVREVAAAVVGALGPVPLVTVGAARPLDEAFGEVRKSTEVAMAHPLRAFADPSPPRSPLFFTLAGDPGAMGVARKLFAPIAVHFFEIPEESIQLYHALAALLANGTAFLARGVAGAYRELLGERGEQAAVELLGSAVEALARHGIAAGTTGPAARGDSRAISLHMEVLRHRPALARAYAALLDLFRDAS